LYSCLELLLLIQNLLLLSEKRYTLLV
jgi:hypothetical protein